MAKDPAFLLYSSDFLTGTVFMSNEEVGIYIRLLCVQHQHGGLIKKESFNSFVGDHTNIREKFIETNDGFYNQRLMDEMVIRSRKSSSLSLNAKKRWDSKSNAIACDLHMPTEDENVNEDEDVNKKADSIIRSGLVGKELRLDFFKLWNDFAGKMALAKIKGLSPERTKRINLRMKQPLFREFGDILIAIKEQPFLLGQNERDWKVNFDWLIENDTNYMKVLERRYIKTKPEEEKDEAAKWRTPQPKH